MRKYILWTLVPALLVPVLMLAAGRGLPHLEPAQEQTVPSASSVANSAPERTLLVVNTAGNLQQLGFEEYLTGVLLSEMPASFPDEALKAQAVVARTYTGRRMSAPKHEGAAVCMDEKCCQGYLSEQEYLASGGTGEDVEKIRAAVAGTSGQVLTYEGALIDATYFSCSGGQTEDAVAVWGQDVPYLQSVESPGEEDAPRYTETVSFTPAQFRAMTGCGGAGEPEGWFGTVTYTDGGGVESIDICGEAYTGTELRSMLGLRSTAFTLEVTNDAITITTLGFGHRVGMSQYGARAMALEGADYTEILRHYYTGTELEQME